MKASKAVPINMQRQTGWSPADFSGLPPLSLTPNFSWVSGVRGTFLTASAVSFQQQSTWFGWHRGRCGKPLKRLKGTGRPLPTQLKLGVNETVLGAGPPHSIENSAEPTGA